MAKFILDYIFKITQIVPTPAASTAYLKQICVVVAPKVGVTPGVMVECTTSNQIAALTNNVEAQQILAGGKSKVFILPMDDLDLDDAIETYGDQFFTLFISSDFDMADMDPTQAQGVFTVSSYANLVSGTADKVTIGGIELTAQAGAATPGDATFQAASSNDATATSLATQINAHETLGELVEATAAGAAVTVKAIESGPVGNDITATYTDNDTNVGGAWTGLSDGKLSGGDGLFASAFKGVIAIGTTDEEFAAEQAAIENRVAWVIENTNKLKNLAYAFGKFLSASSWANQQYITLPFASPADVLGEAESLFDDKISFAITDEEFGNRLALFAAGGKAIFAPYVIRNLEIDLQSKALQYISANQPAYTLTQAALLEDELQKVADSYVSQGLIERAVVTVTLVNENFVASAAISVAEPKALWRIAGTLRQT